MHMGKIWAITVIIGILMVLIPPIRHVVSHFLTNFVSPAVRSILKGGILWIWAALKGIFRYHFILIRNLLTPRQALFKTLDTAENDEK